MEKMCFIQGQVELSHSILSFNRRFNYNIRVINGDEPCRTRKLLKNLKSIECWGEFFPKRFPFEVISNYVEMFQG